MENDETDNWMKLNKKIFTAWTKKKISQSFKQKISRMLKMDWTWIGHTAINTAKLVHKRNKDNWKNVAEYNGK